MKNNPKAKFGIRLNKDEVIRDLTETTLSLGLLGKKYEVTRQAMSQFVKREGIKRPPKPRREFGHPADQCSICQKILQISQKPRSEFISSGTIKEKLGRKLRPFQYDYHLRVLRVKGIVHPKFARIHSKKVEKAYSIYFKESLPVSEIGRKTGLKNFASIIRGHRESGWDVPPSLFVYTGKARSRIVKAAQQRRLRDVAGTQSG
jgi:hypothetical protein